MSSVPELVTDLPSYLTRQQVADRLNVSIWTVRRLIADGALRAFKIRGQYRIDPRDLDKYLAKHQAVKATYSHVNQ